MIKERERERETHGGKQKPSFAHPTSLIITGPICTKQEIAKA
jgi:hypothetical protein